MASLRESITEKLLYRFVKKRIAGITMNAAIDQVKSINGRSILATASFLSEDAIDRAKARYATTTYLELVRRIGQLGLKASVQIPASQVGSLIDEQLAAENLRNIIDTANRYGVFVWLEPAGIDSYLYSLKAKGIGYVTDLNGAKSRILDSNVKAIKLIFPEDEYRNETAFKIIEAVAKRHKNTVVHSAPDKLVGMLLRGSKYKKSLILEFPLDYSRKKLDSFKKRGCSASVYVPFGKDWLHYALNKVQSKYIRLLAKRLLEERNGVV